MAAPEASQRTDIRRIRLEWAAAVGAALLLGGAVGVLSPLLALSLPARLGLLVLLAAVAGAGAALRVRAQLGFLNALAAAAESLAEGQALARLDEERLGRFGAVGRHFNQIFDALGTVAHRVLGVVDRVRGLPARLAEILDEIQRSAGAQEEAVEESASLMANINNSIRDINERVDKLSRAADESASSILQMGSSVEEVARHAGSLQSSVESSTSSVHQMSASIRQVAESTGSVQRMAEETASSMIEMERAVQEVGNHVQEASALSERVSESADEGSRAVAATIRDIADIDARTRDAKSGLDQLVERIGEIAEILASIGDINDETNLLSLNAAIIAAQAGEQGKAFLVVANHVKVLAQRTATSTRDIANLIQSVRSDSDAALEAMSAGMDAITQGVKRSQVAGDSLRAIRETAEVSSQRVAEIARASEEQTRTSVAVTRAAQETSTQVQQITQAMSEQTRASEQMLQASQSALELCRHVYRSTEEQKETGRYITSSISSITDMIRLIQQSTAQHAQASESVSEAVMVLLDNAQKGGRLVPDAQTMLAELRDGAERIVDELARFELAPADFGAEEALQAAEPAPGAPSA